MSGETILLTAFRATFKSNKWSFADCINCSYNFMWKLSSVMFSVNYMLDMETSWFMACGLLVLSTGIFSLFPVCSSPRLLWGGLGLCWVVCICLWKSISYQQRLIHQSTACLHKYVIFIISFHFRKENLPWKSRTVIPLPLPLQNSCFCNRRVIFYFWA